MSEAAADDPRDALELVHHHPGRLRLRADLLRDPEVAARVQAALNGEPGILRVSHNPKIGSVLIEYQPGLVDADVLIACVAGAAGLDPPVSDLDPRARRAEPGKAAIRAAKELNEIVYELTGFQADMRTLVPLGLSALAAYSFATSKEPKLPRWDNLLYWSYNIFSQLHRREIDASDRELPKDGAASAPSPRAEP